jgi:tetratricopeptide (TPR) repeat protein
MNTQHQRMNAALLIAPIVLSLSYFSAHGSPAQAAEPTDHYRKAQEYLHANKPDLAIPEFIAAIADNANNVEAQANLGVLLFFNADYNGAAPHLRAALTLKPDLWKVRSLLGMSEKRIGESADARKDLESAFEHLDDLKVRVQTGLELVEIYSQSGDMTKAASLAAEMRELDPTNIQVLYTAYRVFSNMASESMLSLALVAPESAQMHQIMAQELVRKGDYTKAIDNYRQAIAEDPTLPGAHLELAQTLEMSPNASEQSQAAAEYSAAIAANRFDEQSEFRLGRIAAKQYNLKDAKEHYSRALALQPADADVLTGLAKIESALNNSEKAMSLLQRSIQLDPTSAQSHYLLSSLYRAAGRSADASREIQEYLKYKNLHQELVNTFKQMRLPLPKGDSADAENQ